jgi:hypothetical protein
VNIKNLIFVWLLLSSLSSSYNDNPHNIGEPDVISKQYRPQTITVPQFLRHLRNLDSDVPDRLLRIIWTSRLPSNIQVALAGMPEIELDTAALCANRIIEAIYPASLASIAPVTGTCNMFATCGKFSWKAPTHTIITIHTKK